MTDPLMARMAAQMRQTEIATIDTQMDAAVAAGDTALVRKLSDKKGEIMAQAAPPAPKFNATDVRNALTKLAPEAVKDLGVRQALANVANSIASGTIDISDFESPEELAKAMLKSAGHDVDAKAAAAAAAEAAKKAEEEAAAKKKAEEEAAAATAAGEDDEDEDDEDEDDGEDDEEDPEPEPKPAKKKKPVAREEPSLGSGRPAGSAARSLDKITKVTELPKESRAQWERMTRNGGMADTAKRAAQGDEMAKAQLAGAEKSYVTAEVRRLKALRKK